MKVCECRTLGCRTPVGVDHDMYTRHTGHGRRFVAAKHHDAHTERVVRTFADGNTLLVEGRFRPKTEKRKQEPMVSVVCPDCDAARDVRARQARRIAAGEHSGQCSACRYPDADVRALRAAATSENFHGFWRSRFSQDEIDFMWSGLSLYLDLPTEAREAA